MLITFHQKNAFTF